MERDETRILASVTNLLFAIFLLIPISVFSTPLDKAITLYHQGDFQNSHQALLKLSRENNSQAFFLLGKMYERGDGVFRDESKAILYYQKAAALGFDEAAQRIDQLHEGENSVVLDWYLESAWDGDIESVFNLGYLYESGMGVRIDESLALQWYEEAASQGHADAQLRLGLMLIAGAGIDDVNSGKQWVLKAAANGNKVAKTIKDLLIKYNKNLDFVKLIRGLRTLEHSDQAKMLQVLLSSAKTMSQPKSLSLLHEPMPVISNAPKNNSVNESLSSAKLEKEREIKFSPSSSTNVVTQNETAVLFWVIFSIVLTGIFTTLVHFFFHKRFGFSSGSTWNEQHRLVLPEVKIDSSDREFLKKLWGREKSISIPENFPRELEPLDIKPFVFDDADTSYASMPKERSVLENNLEDNVQVRAQISCEDLMPVCEVDLQKPVSDSLEEPLLLEKLILPTEFESSAMKHVTVQEKEIKNVARDSQNGSYIKQQAKEFEISQSDDVNAVSEARLNIGLMFLHGDGVVKNIPLAIKWLKRSAEHGNQDADAQLKELYVDYPEFIEVDAEEHRFSA